MVDRKSHARVNLSQIIPACTLPNGGSSVILSRMLKRTSIFFFAIFCIPAAAQKPIHLPATPKTVAWGYYDAAAVPVLTIKSGDTVIFDTLITNSPKRLESAGV